MKQISGVLVEVRRNGEHVEVLREDGYLGRFSGGRLELRVSVAPGWEAYGLKVVGHQKHLTKVRARRPIINEEKGWRVYRITVPILHGAEGAHTEYETNNLRLLGLESGGLGRMFEVAVVAQDGHFFLTVGLQYEFRYFRDGGRVVCPQFEKWIQLVELLGELHEERIGRTEDLPPVEEYRPEEEVTADGLTPNTGRVKFWGHGMNLGVIITPEGPARVYWSEIKKERPDELAELLRGWVVEFEELRPLYSSRSTLKLQAIGVRQLRQV